MADTPCKEKPWRCQPRPIKHVSFDADETMWDIFPHVIATNVCGPFTLIDPDTVEAYECGSKSYTSTTITPKKPSEPYSPGTWYDWGTHSYTGSKKKDQEPTLGEITNALMGTLTPKQKRLVELVEQDRLSMKDLSKSEQAVVHAAEKAKAQQPLLPPPEKPKEIAPVAIQPKKEPDKGRKITVKLLPTFRETIAELKKRDISMSIISLNAPGSVRDIMKAFGFADMFVEINDTWKNKGDVIKETMDKHHIAPCNTMFVDNMRGHVEEANKQCALGLVIGKGKDVEKPLDILHFIKD